MNSITQDQYNLLDSESSRQYSEIKTLIYKKYVDTTMPDKKEADKQRKFWYKFFDDIMNYAVNNLSK